MCNRCNDSSCFEISDHKFLLYAFNIVQWWRRGKNEIIIVSIPMEWVSMNDVVCLVRRTSDSYQYMWKKMGFYRSPLFLRANIFRLHCHLLCDKHNIEQCVEKKCSKRESIHPKRSGKNVKERSIVQTNIWAMFFPPIQCSIDRKQCSLSVSFRVTAITSKRLLVYLCC